MTITERHQLILQQLKETGKVSILDLSEQLEVSGVTIRKDLKLLEEKRLLFRTHGGAALNNPYAMERTIHEKSSINADIKHKIAMAAQVLLDGNDSIIIGSGTTVFEFARCLVSQARLTVITPAVKVTLELSNRPNIDVLQLGGIIRPNSSSVAGALAERILNDISCGVLFLGVDGIDLDFGFTITNIAEATLNQKMIETAQKVVVLADSSKFDKRGLGRVCNFDQVQYIVTDSGISKKTLEALEERSVHVIIAQ